MKKIVLGLVISVAITLIIGGGYYFYQNLLPKTSGQVMTVAKYYWPGTYWVEIADQKGWFKEAGLNVQLIDTNADYGKSLKDAASGNLDTVNFSTYDLVVYNNDGANLQTVINSDVSNGTDGIVARGGINSVKNLKNKSVAVPIGTYLEYILDTALTLNGLDPDKDIVKVNVTAEEALAGFIAGKYDAMVNWQPNLSNAVTNSDIKIIFDTSQLPGLNSGNWVFKKDFIAQRPADVEAFVNVWNKTTDFIKHNPDEAYGIIAKIYQVPIADVASLADIDKIYSLNENLAVFTYSTGYGSLHGSIQKINDYLFNKNDVAKTIDSTEIINPRFIRALIK